MHTQKYSLAARSHTFLTPPQNTSQSSGQNLKFFRKSPLKAPLDTNAVSLLSYTTSLQHLERLVTASWMADLDTSNDCHFHLISNCSGSCSSKIGDVAAFPHHQILLFHPFNCIIDVNLQKSLHVISSYSNMFCFVHMFYNFFSNWPDQKAVPLFQWNRRARQ